MYSKFSHYFNIQFVGILICIGGFILSSGIFYLVTIPKIANEFELVQKHIVKTESAFYKQIFEQEIKGWIEETTLLAAVPDVINNIMRADGQRGLVTYLDSIKFSDDMQAIKIYDVLQQVIYKNGLDMLGDSVNLHEMVKELLSQKKSFGLAVIEHPEPLLLISLPVRYVNNVEGVIIAAFKIPWEELIGDQVNFKRNFSLSANGLFLNSNEHDLTKDKEYNNFIFHQEKLIGPLNFHYIHSTQIDKMVAKIRFDIFSVIVISLLIIYACLYFLGRKFVFNPYQSLQKALNQNRINTEVINNAIDSVVISDASDFDDPDGSKIEYVNKSFEVLTGYKKHEVLGKTHSMMQGDETDPFILRDIKNKLRNNEPVTAQLVNYSKQGEKIWIDLSVVPISLDDGSLKFASFLRDITERKTQEVQLEEFAYKLELKNFELYETAQNLQRSEAFSDNVVQHMLNAILVFDESGVVLRANKSTESYFELSSEQLLGSHVDNLLPNIDMHTIDDYVSLDETHTYNASFYSKRNNLVHALYMIGKMQVEGERLYIISLFDITKQKAAEDASKAKSLFISSVSHELRTPLHAIISYSKFGVKDLKQNKINKTLDNFSTIELSARRLLTLVNDILDFTKMESGNIALDYELVTIDDMIRSVVKELNSLLEQKSISINIKLAAEITCAFDKRRITQVLINILSNAIKHVPDAGIITITASTESQYVVINIQDNGPGVVTEHLDSIFELFTQTEKGHGQGGTGLGLTIAKKIIDAHHGSIVAENVQPNGLKVKICLPLITQNL